MLSDNCTSQQALALLIIKQTLYLTFKRFDSFAINISSFNQTNYLELKENPPAPRGTLGQSKGVYLPLEYRLYLLCPFFLGLLIQG
jgi:ubiquitin C-terminal hydrolase